MKRLARRLTFIDLFAAGFPCQPFSLAGVSKKNSLGREPGFRDDTQGTLFFRLAEIIEAKRPRALLLAYRVFAEVIDAAGWVPQHWAAAQGAGKTSRRLTPAECSRLMGFDGRPIAVSGTQANRQVGNALCRRSSKRSDGR